MLAKNTFLKSYLFSGKLYLHLSCREKNTGREIKNKGNKIILHFQQPVRGDKYYWGAGRFFSMEKS